MRKTWLLFSQAVTVAVAVLFVVGTLKPVWLQGHPVDSVAVAPASAPFGSIAPLVEPMPVIGGVVASSYSSAAKRASPSVVSITASRAPARTPGPDDPMFRFFFGDRARQMQQERQVGLGSGVIVSPTGYLLTNNHVIDGADDIEVALSDGRTAKAKLI
ncbi:MAG: trypsin-like peptidase domain-containing protein, partial [Caldimonas sp.]